MLVDFIEALGLIDLFNQMLECHFYDEGEQVLLIKINKVLQEFDSVVKKIEQRLFFDKSMQSNHSKPVLVDNALSLS